MLEQITTPNLAKTGAWMNRHDTPPPGLDIQNVFDWQNKPYHPISQHYLKRFGTKVFKVSVSTAQTCPNREGLNGSKVCSFCDEWGSAAYHLEREKSLSQQIQINREAIRKRYHAHRFLVYFQAYTNTLGKAQRLREWFETALMEKDVVGIVLGTRPDCLPHRVIEFFKEYSEKHYLSVELGIQSLVNEQLLFLSRGHDAKTSLNAIEKLKRIPELNVCAHLIFGIPGETDEQLISTARMLSEKKIDGVKLHNLHVLRGTPLEQTFLNGDFEPLTLEEYARRVALFLEHLDPKIAVHRLAAVATRWNELLVPDWNREKMRPMQFIEDYMRSNEMHQGRLSENLQEEIPGIPHAPQTGVHI